MALGLTVLDMAFLRLELHPAMKLSRTESRAISLLEFVQRQAILDKIDSEAPS